MLSHWRHLFLDHDVPDSYCPSCIQELMNESQGTRGWSWTQQKGPPCKIPKGSSTLTFCKIQVSLLGCDNTHTDQVWLRRETFFNSAWTIASFWQIEASEKPCSIPLHPRTHVLQSSVVVAEARESQLPAGSKSNGTHMQFCIERGHELFTKDLCMKNLETSPLNSSRCRS